MSFSAFNARSYGNSIPYDYYYQPRQYLPLHYNQPLSITHHHLNEGTQSDLMLLKSGPVLVALIPLIGLIVTLAWLGLIFTDGFRTIAAQLPTSISGNLTNVINNSNNHSNSNTNTNNDQIIINGTYIIINRTGRSANERLLFPKPIELYNLL